MPRLLPAVTVAALLFVGAAAAQPDLKKALVGQWDGEQEALYEKNLDQRRVLYVERVRQVDGRWVAEGRFGIPGKGMGRVKIDVDGDAKPVALRFISVLGTQHELFLLREKSLVGNAVLTLEQARGGRAGSDSRERRLKMEKAN